MPKTKRYKKMLIQRRGLPIGKDKSDQLSSRESSYKDLARGYTGFRTLKLIKTGTPVAGLAMHGITYTSAFICDRWRTNCKIQPVPRFHVRSRSPGLYGIIPHVRSATSIKTDRELQVVTVRTRW